MIHGVIHAVARSMLLTPADILSPRRTAYMVKARKVCAVILRDRYGLTWIQIARLIGRDDPKTAYYNYITGHKLIAVDVALAAVVARHMAGPKLPHMTLDRFVPRVRIDLGNCTSPKGISRRTAQIAERVWRAGMYAA